MITRYTDIQESRDAMDSIAARPVTPNSDDSEQSHWDASGHESFGDNRIKDRSPSIPIAPGRPTRTASEVRQDEEEAMADYRDLAMFTRIVDGITKTQQMTRDCRWRHENDMTLQHIYNARNDDHQQTLTQWKIPAKLQMNLPTNSLVSLMSHPQVEYTQEDEDLFIMDL